jgi:hypothetical protein
MKRITALALFFVTISALAAELNTDAYLAANPDVRAAGLTAYQHVNMISGDELTSRLAAADALVKKATIADVKIMFCDTCYSFSENATILPPDDWYLGIYTRKTNAKDMVKAGWSIQSTFSLNAKQYYIVFVR